MSDLREAIAHEIYSWATGDEWGDADAQQVKSSLKGADAILALLREHGLVELDKDQSLPPNTYVDAGVRAMYTMFLLQCRAAGFKKVKEIA